MVRFLSPAIGSTAALVLALATNAPAELAMFDCGAGILAVDTEGHAWIEPRIDPSVSWPKSTQPIIQVETTDGVLMPESVLGIGDGLVATFPGGDVCELAIERGDGYFVFEVIRLDFKTPPARLRLFSLPLPEGAETMGTLNAGGTVDFVVSLSAAEPNVHAYTETSGRHESDRTGCSHELAPVSDAQVGSGAARFSATSNAEPGGWSCVSRTLPTRLDLTGLKAIRAWVHGDAKGELLKIQLYDGAGGYRDTYVAIDFEGWRQVTVAEAALNTLNPEHVAALNLYYNALPLDATVTCLVDQIEAVCERDGAETAILLEDFEPESPYWAGPTTSLCVETVTRHGLLPARFGIVAARRAEFLDAMQRFEVAAGLPSPRPGGEWNKRSPWVKQSYLFITSFKEPQFDDVLALARRGGFGMILIGQESWAKATGHYEINTGNFPDGLDGLVRTFRRFRDEGFHVGLHFLGASIYPPDPYLAPVPDPRLVRDAEAALAAEIDAAATTIPTVAAPEAFPAEDGGYTGDGTIIQIDDELMAYRSRAMEAPFGFTGCARGVLGTAAAAHATGAPVRHLKRSYGYFLYDMDTSLLDEVTTNFAKVANACDVDMIYFDGSERLQGDHWYYNARLHKAFYDKLARKDILLQASSFSHYSWHMLARSASADGHGDLKGYLDERSAWLDAFKRDAMPLDIGWYYGYDPQCTPDMYEYVLGASIGYDASVSFQVSADAASIHPFTGEILDLIARYETLRLSGRVGDEMRARLRIDPVLAGEKTPEERNELLAHRREYRLLSKDGSEAFQRVVYAPWHPVEADEDREWQMTVPAGPARVGVQIHVEPGPWLAPGPTYASEEARMLESFDDLAPYLRNRGERNGVTALAHGEAGSTKDGVTQSVTLAERGDQGGQYALYAAESKRSTADGWTVFGKTFDPPLDLSWHKALGFWMRGDGKGGQFKLQLLDGSKAADYYVPNNYTGWRYHQLARPETDPIDYGNVRTLNFYYNGLPAQAAVACGIDDVKALPAVDAQTLTEPWVEVGGARVSWHGELGAGQYLFLWPGEAPRLYGPAFHEPVIGEMPVPDLTLNSGPCPLRFGCAGAVSAPARVRITLQLEERHRVE